MTDEEKLVKENDKLKEEASRRKKTVERFYESLKEDEQFHKLMTSDNRLFAFLIGLG